MFAPRIDCGMALLPCAVRRVASFILPFALIADPALGRSASSPSPQPGGPSVPPVSVEKTPYTGPWLYEGSDVPQDRAWTFGVLPNGLRYAVRHNGVPPGQVSIRILVDAGSLYETDAEQGYAHLLEHLSFRESKYLKEGEAIPRWQQMGATFGTDTNAETSPTQTVFKLDLPDAVPAKLDETFKLLSGMITAPIFTPKGVATEVPIVLAEKREHAGLGQRVGDRSRQTLYAGQPLASRPPIGTDATLNAATADSVRAFHDRWYRPDNTVVIVAGDADPKALEAQVTKWFADWKPGGPIVPAPNFGEPRAPEGALNREGLTSPVGETAVLVEPDLPRLINWAILRPWHKKNDTIAYNQGLMIDRLAMALINRRLETRARAGGSYLSASLDQADVSRSANVMMVQVTPLGPDWRAAVRDVRSVIADALARPPSAQEIAREVAEFEVAFKVPVETQETLASSKTADDIASAVDIRETVAAPDTVYEIFKRSIPLFKPTAVLEHTRALLRGTVERAVLVTPKAGEADAAALRAALTEPVSAATGARLAPSKLTFAALPAIGTPGTVVADQPTGILEISQAQFSNGVRALLWTNDAEPGRVIVKVRFGGGYKAIARADAIYGPLGNAALMDSGIGKLSRDDLDRLATGRKLGLEFAIEDASFVMSGDTRRADLADQLYLFAAKLATPRWDPNPIQRAKAAQTLQYEAYNGAPKSVLDRDLGFLARGNDPRFAVPTPKALTAATPEEFRRVWSQLLAQGPVEVDIFGDFDKAQTLATLAKTFGALPARAPLPPSDLAPQLPPHNATPVVLTHRGEPDQAAAVVAWPTGGGRAGIHESRALELLVQIMSNRLFDAMRERIGASYSPNVSSNWPLDLPSGGFVAATVQLRPGDLGAFFAAADKIASDLATTPPTAEEIARVTEPLKQYVSRASTGNGFYMYQLTGGAFEPRKFTDIRSVLADYTQTTPEAMQALAQRYLVPGRAWRLEVVPEKK